MKIIIIKFIFFIKKIFKIIKNRRFISFYLMLSIDKKFKMLDHFRIIKSLGSGYNSKYLHFENFNFIFLKKKRVKLAIDQNTNK